FVKVHGAAGLGRCLDLTIGCIRLENVPPKGSCPRREHTGPAPPAHQADARKRASVAGRSSMRKELLFELHAHTTWSDGDRGVRELVDLYGSAGFDVLAVTDHVVRLDDPYLLDGTNRSVEAGDFDAYLAEVEREAKRARELYGLLVIPGIELTLEDSDPAVAAHAVAVGLRTFIGLEDGLERALARARDEGAALVAAHPYTLDAAQRSPRCTARFAVEPEWAAGVVDRFELCNRHDFFPWVAEARLPVVANGDFHRFEHLATWKTVIDAEKTEAAVIDFLRSRRPVELRLVERTAVT